MTVARIEVGPGAFHHPGFFDRAAQEALLADIRAVIVAAPLYQPRMPRSGRPFSVRMTNCGPLGWVSDIDGYRYQDTHPDTGKPWPPMPAALLAAWETLAGDDAPQPQACLVNWYGEGTRMGLHQDKDEAEFGAPVVSLSLGDTALFRIGGTSRKDKTLSLELHSGDAFVFGGPARLAYHGIDRVLPGTSALLAEGGRFNLTLRRVTKPP